MVKNGMEKINAAKQTSPQSSLARQLQRIVPDPSLAAFPSQTEWKRVLHSCYKKSLPRPKAVQLLVVEGKFSAFRLEES